MFKVIQRFHFDMAHRLMKHEGKCRFLHGHSYVAEVEFQTVDLNDSQMALDFAEVKRIAGEWIDRFWDHSVLLNKEDPLLKGICDTLPEMLSRVQTVEGDPTAENMARRLAGVIQERIKSLQGTTISAFNLRRVRIEETANCFAEFIVG